MINGSSTLLEGRKDGEWDKSLRFDEENLVFYWWSGRVDVKYDFVMNDSMCGMG